MSADIRWFLARLNANYWFYPALFSVAAALLAFVLVWADRHGFGDWILDNEWIIPARPQVASDMLTVMAGSMIAVASTVFSITIAAVAYASGTYGPRLLTNFLEDRGNQLSLATFIGSFVYAIVVLRSVRAEDEVAPAGLEQAASLPGFTPQLSLLVAYFLLATCVGVLVFFLNHVPSSIQINVVIERIARRLLKTIEETYPHVGDLREARAPVPGAPVAAQATGYIRLIDFAELEGIARASHATLSLRVRTGDFVHPGLTLLEVTGGRPAEREAIIDCFSLGATRTPEQDPHFLIDELVEIGLRALSPGINDPFTAITAIHWLGAATADLGQRDLRKDVCGKDVDDCPVIPCPDDFSHFLKRGFGSLRSAVATAPIASEIMFQAIADARRVVGADERRTGLRHQADELIAQARLALVGPDLERVEAAYRDALFAFDH
jgi:uncharacterized membrane protein